MVTFHALWYLLIERPHTIAQRGRQVITNSGVSFLRKFVLLAAALGFALFSTVAFAKTYVGKASYYKKGRMTASGERFRPMAMTAAHRYLPFGTVVRVTHIRSGRKVVVRINDRGPFIRGRIIDLSLGAARRIGLNRYGVSRVRVEVIGRKRRRR